MTPITVKDAANANVSTYVADADGLLIKGNSGPYAPGYDLGSEGGGPIQVDPDGQVRTRGPVLTDEGTFRANFANTSLAVSIGSATFVNGSDQVAVNLTSTTDLHMGDYVKLDADGESAWVQVSTVDSMTSITLAAPYSGTGGTGASSRAIVKPFTGSGGSIAVSNGQLVLTSGTTDAASTGVMRLVDVAPLVFRDRVMISQRIANQTTRIGMEEDAATPRWLCRFEADGTDNTVIKTVTGRNPTGAPSANEREVYTVKFPNGGTSAVMHDYRVEFMAEAVYFYIDGVRVSTHIKVMPAQHDEVTAETYIVNGTGAASSTTVTVDMMTCKNHNKLEIGIMSDSETVVANQPDSQLFSYSQAGVIAINTTLLQVDCRRYRSFDIHAISIGTTGVVTPQQSLDGGTTWATIAVTNLNTGAATITLASGASHRVIVGGGLFRLQLTTATTAGTTTIAMSASQVANPFTPNNLPINLVQISGAANSSGGATGGLGVGGFVAHSAGTSGNPVQIGGVVSTALETSLVASDMSRALMTTAQQLVTKQYGTAENDWRYTGVLTTTTAAALKAAGAASIRNNLTDFQYQNTSAVATTVLIRDNVTTIAQFHAPANMALPACIQFSTPIRGTAATALNVVCGTTGANVLVNAAGFQAF